MLLVCGQTFEMIEQLMIVDRRGILIVLCHLTYAASALEGNELDICCNECTRIEGWHIGQRLFQWWRTCQNPFETIDLFGCDWVYLRIFVSRIHKYLRQMELAFQLISRQCDLLEIWCDFPGCSVRFSRDHIQQGIFCHFFRNDQAYIVDCHSVAIDKRWSRWGEWCSCWDYPCRCS